MFVSANGELLALDNEINFDAIKRKFPNINGRKVVEYWFGRYRNFMNGICALCWIISPDGSYFADEDGYGMEDNERKWFVASSIRKWNLSYHSSQRMMLRKC